MNLLALLMPFQEVAAEVAEVVAPVADGLTVQAVAAMALPLVVQLLKRLVPQLEGKSLFYANMLLNLATAGLVIVQMDVPIADALGVALAGGLAGSKAVDVAKSRTVAVSDRHKRA